MEKINKYLDSNNHLFTKEYILSMFGDQNFQMKPNNLDVVTETCNEKYVNFIKKIFSNVTYVDIEKFFDKYNRNLDHIASLSVDHHIIFITTHDAVVKSNFWLTMYSIQYLKNRNVQLNYAYNIISNFLNIPDDRTMCKEQPVKDEYTELNHRYENHNINKFLLVFCDDISYSGKQLSGHLSGQCDGDATLQVLATIPSNVTIYLNLYGLTKTAREKIGETGIRNDKIIIPVSDEDDGNIKTLGNVLDKIAEEESCENTLQCIAKNSLYNLFIINGEIMVEPLFYSYFPFNLFTKSISYLFFKYPDALSTIPSLCYFDVPFGYTLDVDMLMDSMFSGLNFDIDTLSYQTNMFELNQLDLNLTNDNKAEIKAILNGDVTHVDKYPWITKCDNQDKENRVMTINSMDDYQYSNKRNGSCEKLWKEHPKSFYKEIDYTIDKLKGFYENTTPQTGGKNIYQHKYLKYKEKNRILLKKLKM